MVQPSIDQDFSRTFDVGRLSTLIIIIVDADSAVTFHHKLRGVRFEDNTLRWHVMN